MLTVLNIFGIWRWLGRQARVEEGARAAAEASEATPGEALFPVSLLSRAPVDCGGGAELGHASTQWPAAGAGGWPMSWSRKAASPVSARRCAGCRGPTLHVEGERVKSRITAGQFARLEELPKDQWPAR